MRTDYKTKVFGVDRGNRQKIIKKHVREGQKLLFIRESKNPVDPNAIGIWAETSGLLRKKRLQIGYLSEQWAKQIAPALDGGWRYDLTVLAVTGGTRDKPTRGVNIQIKLLEPE